MASKLALVADDARIDQARDLIDQVAGEIGQIVLGKDREIRLALACALAGGHLLIEDVPGVGKTLLARSIALALGLGFSRIQFTSDLLPADIVGISIYDSDNQRFAFQPGPVFAQVVLADEVNRATAKAQSALLEAMEEQQVSVDGETHELPEPFFVIATQNPVTQVGTFPLPESQLDRFMMRLHLGYPSAPLERELLRGDNRRDMLDGMRPVLCAADVIELQRIARSIHLSEALLDYAQALIAWTRTAPGIELGLSPRAAADLIAAARCRALMQGHAGARPEDLKAVFPTVVAHRLRLADDVNTPALTLAERALESVPIP